MLAHHFTILNQGRLYLYQRSLSCYNDKIVNGSEQKHYFLNLILDGQNEADARVVCLPSSVAC